MLKGTRLPSHQTVCGALQMATGTPPNADLHPMRALFLIPKSPAPALLGPYSQPLKDFVARCLKKVRTPSSWRNEKAASPHGLLAPDLPAATTPGTPAPGRMRRCGRRQRSCWRTPLCVMPR